MLWETEVLIYSGSIPQDMGEAILLIWDSIVQKNDAMKIAMKSSVLRYLAQLDRDKHFHLILLSNMDLADIIIQAAARASTSVPLTSVLDR